MKIAVTAASGGLGKAIIRQLLNQLPSNQITGIARTIDKVRNLGVEIKKGDYNSKKNLLKP